jgi:hypothetical protein
MTNARSVSINAARKHGILLTLLLLLALLQPMRAAEINATITGVLTGGWDQLGIFATGKDAQNMGGQPFTLVFTFDDTKGTMSSHACNSGTDGGGKAVLTIAGASYTFDAVSSGAYRSIAGGTCPGQSMINFAVSRQKSFFDFAPAVDVRIVPRSSNGSLAKDPDWRSPLSITTIDNQSSCFFIARYDRPNKEAKGCFDIKKLEITKR